MKFAPFDLSPSLNEIAKRYSWSIPIIASLAFLSGALEGFGISLLIPLLGSLIADQAGGSKALELPVVGPWLNQFPPLTRLYLISGAVFIAILLKAIVLIANTTLASWVDSRAGHDIRSTYGKRILTVGYPFFLSQDPARLISIMSTETWRANEAIKTLFAMISAGAVILVFALILFAIDWRLSLVVVLGMLLIRLFQTVIVKRLMSKSRRISEANQAYSGRVMLAVEFARLIRIFGQEKREQARFDEASDRLRRAVFKVAASSGRLAPTIEFLQGVLFIGILLAAHAAGIAIPILLTFLVLLYRMQPHMKIVSAGRVSLAGVSGSLREVEWLLDPNNKPAAPTGTITFEKLNGPIEFKDVGFVYSTRRDSGPILKASCTIHTGRATALIGRSGSGKSTLVNLLCRFLEPTEGVITVNGIDLSQIEPNSWRRRIGLAGQDVDLIDGTIAENIAYGEPDAPMEDVIAAARRADADRFIQGLPAGYQTRVGPRGLGLSGGQRQRIGIARALMRRPEILILDEATNSVDSRSESAIIDLLRQHDQGMTTIVISHHASTLAYCDDGIVIENGEVIEAGPLNQLTLHGRPAEHRESTSALNV